MKEMQEPSPPFLTTIHHCGRKQRSSPSGHDSLQSDVFPLEILLDHIVPFLDRKTYNSCLLLCRRAREVLRGSWWRQGPSVKLPPWPSKLVSRDPTCRVRCLTFSSDHSILACGCSDGKIRSWDVRIGELPEACRGHFPDEAVVALSYNHNMWRDNQLLASSSTDGTIRIWKVDGASATSREWRDSNSAFSKNRDIQSSVNSIAGSYSQKEHATMDIECLENLSNHSVEQIATPRCVLRILADNAYSLHFSPDDSYLVSGHVNIEVGVNFIETIQIWNVTTGMLLRRLENNGLPLGFLPSSVSKKHHHEMRDPWNEPGEERDKQDCTAKTEDQLITTCGPTKTIKLWRWNHSRFGISNHDEFNSNLSFNHHYESAIDSECCVQRWFLDGFHSVLPVPITDPSTEGTCTDRDGNRIKATTGCSILVASINRSDSFVVWNTRRPRESRIFPNSSPFEIQFSPDGRKVASVEDFNKVKVWRISDGSLLKIFHGSEEDTAVDKRPWDRGFDKDLQEDCDSHEVKGPDSSFADCTLFPIHELVFSKDSSTLAVISRCLNEIHLITT